MEERAIKYRVNGFSHQAFTSFLLALGNDWADFLQMVAICF